MVTFQIGETVLINHIVQKKVGGVYVDYDPVTSIKVSVYKIGTVTALTSDASMMNDAVGYYHYDYQTVGLTAGTYRARVTDTDGTHITKKDAEFILEA